MSIQVPPHINLNDDKGPLAIRSIMACSVLAGFAVLGRFLSRRLVKADLWTTDFLNDRHMGSFWSHCLG